MIPWHATSEVAKTFAEGAERYGETAWHSQSVTFLLNHAISHLSDYLKGDRSEEHLNHAACNLLMAMEIDSGRHR